ncbi:Putative translation initiation inhibitor, yjgF family [Georgfuchsia toluolica]|uniref:Translation initiation inhibitor, yjgF family n=1 Tax=Georgfuchsia toluolica TaxID=424218 RepID=A0A916J4N5_9PROT|nr:RidA family protein [Georgfuchsia toluolica]CAG4883906.1 Putative translation initiation inhibitor, yjgF family [Georgfuchsia toluolica]
MQVLRPPGWRQPKGYSNGIAARGTMVFVAGQVGFDVNEEFKTDNLVDQSRQALANIVTILAEAGARPEHIVRMTWYLADKDEYNTNQKGIGEAYRDVIGRHFPVMTAIQVAGFVEDGAKVEIEATAVIPDA